MEYDFKGDLIDDLEKGELLRDNEMMRYLCVEFLVYFRGDERFLGGSCDGREYGYNGIRGGRYMVNRSRKIRMRILMDNFIS